MPGRIYTLISFPSSFKEKFFGIINNVNAVNSDKELPIRVEECYKKKSYAATPKKPNIKGYDNESKD